MTQGIQKFRIPDGADNSIAVVAAKDTAVRLYVAADNLKAHHHHRRQGGGGFFAGWFEIFGHAAATPAGSATAIRLLENAIPVVT